MTLEQLLDSLLFTTEISVYELDEQTGFITDEILYEGPSLFGKHCQGLLHRYVDFIRVKHEGVISILVK